MPARKISTATAKTVQTGNPEVIAHYEQAMAELEHIVARLEQGEQTLEQSLADYERGTQLARQCEQALKEAERRIDALAVPDAAEPGTDLNAPAAKDFFQ